MRCMEMSRYLNMRYRKLMPRLDERSRRLVAAADCATLGRGGISLVARASGLSRPTLYQGVLELKGTARPASGRRASRVRPMPPTPLPAAGISLRRTFARLPDGEFSPTTLRFPSIQARLDSASDGIAPRRAPPGRYHLAPASHSPPPEPADDSVRSIAALTYDNGC